MIELDQHRGLRAGGGRQGGGGGHRGGEGGRGRGRGHTGLGGHQVTVDVARVEAHLPDQLWT